MHTAQCTVHTNRPVILAYGVAEILLGSSRAKLELTWIVSGPRFWNGQNLYRASYSYTTWSVTVCPSTKRSLRLFPLRRVGTHGRRAPSRITRSSLLARNWRRKAILLQVLFLYYQFEPASHALQGQYSIPSRGRKYGCGWSYHGMPSSYHFSRSWKLGPT
ncbi:hypothetical protein BJY04DRAFT_125518 [Aspergillus karnatakaensis]|uniref:uncharacterized protein n=1 Tax=Aspergillus karnatakaensis TaxID=1810916 RepID=UPI003CCD861F